MSNIGVGIITCNRAGFFRTCIDSIRKVGGYDEIVIINDGKTQIDLLEDLYYIHNKKNIGVGKSKNKALNYLLKKECEHIFLVEDDVYIKDKDVFNKYIQASKITGIKHLNFCLHGADNKNNGKPSPKLIIDYKDIKLALYHNIYGAFSYYHRSVLDEIGLMDKRYYNAMEHVDHTMQAILKDFHPPFRWFADIENSHHLLDEQDREHEKSEIREKDDWNDRFRKGVELFYNKFDINVCDPNQENASKDEVIEYLKRVKP